MGRTRATKTEQPLTTTQRLGSLLKSARDVMRKDKGLNGDLDRLPMLTWLMFLKFLDDHEQVREQRAILKKEKFKPTIAAPYRWRDWAAKEDGITGEELKKFISNDEIQPAGEKEKRAGLLAYLRSFVGSADARQRVIGDVFSGVQSRMESGYLLRDIVNKINNIHFDSSEEIHTLGHFYESMLKEMRDAAGDSGEFYTPRALVRFMVTATDPKLGETVLDPAAGTGGFLVEAYNHLEKQCKTVEHRQQLQERSIFGQEAKPLPYMLCQMNLLLHGLDAPQIVRGNSLEQKLTELKDSDRVDVILTNPPFGGEEERGIQSNFPEDKQTAETALLFLQLIMRKLRVTPKPGRAAVVVPNGTLFGDGVCARIKQELLTKFNLHTVVRLPHGVFAPYTAIPTNILFFDRSGPTKHVWYYDQPLPEGKKNYTKTSPIQFEEFTDCLAWWSDRVENNRAWKVPAEQIAADGYNLDIKNPNAKQDFEHLPPEQLAADIRVKQDRLTKIMQSVEAMCLTRKDATDWPSVELGQALIHRKKFIQIDDLATYKRCRVQLHAQGVVLRDHVSGTEIKTKKQQVCRAGDFLVAEIDAKVGGYGLVPPELEGAIVSSHYFLFEINEAKLVPEFLDFYIRTAMFHEQVTAQGSTNYAAIRPSHVLSYTIPLPDLHIQREIVKKAAMLKSALAVHSATWLELLALNKVVLERAFRGQL